MSLKYACPGCGTSLGYEGLCWKCKCEQDRQAALAWTPEQIGEKQKNLIQNIQRLAEMEDPEFTDFWQLLGYHDAITPEIQRVALAAEVFCIKFLCFSTICSGIQARAACRSCSHLHFQHNPS